MIEFGEVLKQMEIKEYDKEELQRRLCVLEKGENVSKSDKNRKLVFPQVKESDDLMKNTGESMEMNQKSAAFKNKNLTNAELSVIQQQKDPLRRGGRLSSNKDKTVDDTPPPSYKEMILLSILNQQKGIEGVFKERGGRLESIERTVSQTRQVTDQTLELQQNMNNRLSSIEHNLLVQGGTQVRRK
ncbi:uncharacterized protein LOC132739798 [Ruditapes philippinarum]|uniref:uncharacterized protein LOC132739798 n=1 Tax=Ruditapes philippinarum TaxID=129788 RepID=UPI00295A74CE|nr:uncharacterized protein LOC132739798 [Ruditapes philippinarum]